MPYGANNTANGHSANGSNGSADGHGRPPEPLFGLLDDAYSCGAPIYHGLSDGSPIVDHTGAPAVSDPIRALRPLARHSSTAYSAPFQRTGGSLVDTTFATSFGVKRKFYDSFGWPKVLTYLHYLSAYERGDIARRIIDCKPRDTWESKPLIESEDQSIVNTLTPLIDKLNRLSWIDVLLEVDILSRIGEYGVILIGAREESNGLDDGNGASIDTTKPLSISSPNDLIFLRPLSRPEASIQEIESNPLSPRFGWPTFYNISITTPATDGGIPLATLLPNNSIRVHWTRVIHLADSLTPTATPALKSIFNLLLDRLKILGGGSEATYRQIDRGVIFNLDPRAKFPSPGPSTPSLKPDDGPVKKMNEDLEAFLHGFKRYFISQGMEPKVLVSQVEDFSKNAETLERSIAATAGYPHRKLFGSEQGRLAADQDMKAYQESIAGRKSSLATRWIKTLIDHFSTIGAIESVDGELYDVIWPSKNRLTPKERGQVALSLSSANEKYFKASGGDILIDRDEIRQEFLGLDPFEQDNREVNMSSGMSSNVTSGMSSNTRRVMVQVKDNSRKADKSSRLHGLRARKLQDTAPEIKVIESIKSTYTDRFRDVILSTIVNVRSSITDTGEVSIASIESLISNGETSTDEGVDILADNIASHIAPIFESQLDDIYNSVSFIYNIAGNLYADVVNDRESWFAIDRSVTLERSASTQLRKSIATFNDTNPRAIEWARDHSSQLITDISNSQRDAIRNILADGLSKGQTQRIISLRIRDLIGLRDDQIDAIENLETRLLDADIGDVVTYGKRKVTIGPGGVNQDLILRHLSIYENDLLTQRAELITQSELGDIANNAQRELWRQGVESGELPSVGIGRQYLKNTERHAFMDGMIVGIDEPFIPIEPGEEPNCGCAQILVQL